MQVPQSTSQLHDITTNFASGEEAVGAIFSDGNAKGSRKPRPLRPQAPKILKIRRKVARGSRVGRMTTLWVRQIARTPSGLRLAAISSTRC